MLILSDGFNLYPVVSSLVVIVSAFLLSLQTVFWDLMMPRLSPKVTLPGFDTAGIRGLRRARQVLWRGSPGSILKWLHL